VVGHGSSARHGASSWCGPLLSRLLLRAERAILVLVCIKLTGCWLPRTLPSLNAVKTFEAAVRHGTTVAAAAELGVTHGAVSRQLQQLEDWLGRPLFRREGGRLLVTQAGADYARIAGHALDLLHDGTQELLEISDTIVRISTTASFASEWLMPRLGDFRARHPQIEIWIEEAKDIARSALRRLRSGHPHGPGRLGGRAGRTLDG
jgi:DNA-binding transcriptional LysR family regulator